jgi:hypothetical protein
MADIDIDLQSGSLIFSGSNMSLINSNLLGFSTLEVETDTQNTYLVDELQTRTFDAWPFDQTAYGIGNSLFGSLTNNLPLDWPLWSISGWRSPFYLDDYYYRIHLSTSTLNLGNVLSEQVYTLTLWNAYLTSQILNTISLTSLDSVNVTYPYTIPDTFTPLQEVSFNVSIGTSGSASIDGSINFVYDSPANSATLDITGQRIIVWPFAPQRDFTETREWLTDVITARGSEDREACREYPRVSLSYKYLFKDRETFALAKEIAESVGGLALATPLWTNLTQLSNISAGQTDITVATTNLELEIGSIVIFWKSHEYYELGQIESISSSNIILKLPLTKAFTSCYLAPVYAGYTSGINLNKTKELFNGAISYKIPKMFYQETWSTESFKGLPVYTGGNIVSEGLEEKFVKDVQIFDSETGNLIAFDIENYTRHQQMLAIRDKSLANIVKLRRMFDAIKGKYTTFWLPSFMPDLIAIDPIAASSNSLKVKDANWYKYGVRAIRVYGSTIENFVVIGASNNGDGTETLAFQDNSVAGVSGIYRIEVLDKVRLNNDSIEFVHESLNQVSIKTQVITVKS